MATSPTDIANLALSEIGGRLISSMETENSNEARTCRLHYPQVRDALLRQHQWNFAISRQDLSKLVDAPVSDWDSAWELPADLVRMIRITTGCSLVAGDSFSLEGRTLLTNGLDTVSIAYVSNLIEVPLWDSLFVEAFVYLLASKIAGPISQSPSQSTDMLQKYKAMALPDAKTVDARESQSGENSGYRSLLANSPLVNARYRY